MISKLKTNLALIGAAILAGLVLAYKLFSAGRQAEKADTLEKQREIEKQVDDEAGKVRDKYKEKLKNARTDNSFGSLNDD